MNLNDVPYNTNLWNSERCCFGRVISCDPEDGACLLFEPLDENGDIMGGDIFRTEACFLEPATKERWERVFSGPDCFVFDEMN